MKIIKFLFVSFITIVALASCKKDYDAGQVQNKAICREWWLNLYDETGTTAYYSTRHLGATYNTANTLDSLWFDDYESLWDVKFMCKVNMSDLTFVANDSQNEYYDITVKVTEGKIIPNGTTTKGGNTTDSIYMKVEFSDDPGTKYVIKGCARTSYREDKY